jgi:DNA-binding PadR family transcriptional regulator
MEELTATAAALLGQIAWREQSTYELVKAMGGNLRYFWPRAESHVYREAKHLVTRGLATAQRRRTGRRPRTTYRITPRGRAALAAWLAAPVGGVVLEHEPLLRVFLADNGTRDDVLRAIEAAREHAEEMLEVGAAMGDAYFDGTHPFLEQVHVRALMFDYLWGWATFTTAWAERSEREVRRWSDLAPTSDKHRRALRHLRALVGKPG